MTVHFMTGFDLFGFGAPAAPSDDRPVHGAGLAQHALKPTYSAGTSSIMAGVSGLPRYDMGKGANRRKSLQLWCDGQMTGSLTVAWPLPAAAQPPLVAGAVTVFGMRVKRSRAVATKPMGPINGWFPLLTLGTVPLLTINPAAGRLSVGDNVQHVTLSMVEDQEYYFEVVLTRINATSGYNVELYIDGRKAYNTVRTITIASSAWPSMALGGAGGNYIWNHAISYADMYLSDQRLGPQMVISRQPSIVTEKNWTPSEGNDPLALITGANTVVDTKYIISPEGTETDRYRLDFELKPGIKAHAASAFVRGKRDAASSRVLSLSMRNGATDQPIAPEKTLPGDFSQQAWRTDQLWTTDADTDLTADNLNNLAMCLSAPLS